MNIPLALILGTIIGAGVVLALYRFLKGNVEREKEALKNQFASLSQEALAKASEQFLLLALERFKTEKENTTGEFEKRKQAVESALSGLNEQLKSYEKLVRDFEKDREFKYGSLRRQLEEAALTTDKLQATTDRLTSILGNVKLRGQWGERMAEDILRYSGLAEGVHYLKNKAQDTTLTRPDYIFLLPDEHKVYMDVKFPLDKYILMMNASSDEERKGLEQGFITDVKGRIKEIERRTYINPAEQTLDFVLLFIPNEQVYGFIHEVSPGLIDVALKQKVVLCSPFTLYAVLCVIRQAYDNFHFQKATKEVITMVNGFLGAYTKFRERFEELGARLEKLAEKYTEISQTSFRMLDSKIRKIEEYRKGEGIPAAPTHPEDGCPEPSTEDVSLLDTDASEA